MSMQPPPSAPMSAPPPESGQGHGAFSEQEIEQMMAQTGFSYEQICAAIDQTGATSKEQLFPNIYTGKGIDPSTMQDPSAAAPVAPPMQSAAAPPVMAPTEDAPSPEMAPQMAAPGAMQGIPPELAQAMHREMMPHLGLPLKPRRR